MNSVIITFFVSLWNRFYKIIEGSLIYHVLLKIGSPIMRSIRNSWIYGFLMSDDNAVEKNSAIGRTLEGKHGFFDRLRDGIFAKIAAPFKKSRVIAEIRMIVKHIFDLPLCYFGHFFGAVIFFELFATLLMGYELSTLNIALKLGALVVSVLLMFVKRSLSELTEKSALKHLFETVFETEIEHTPSVYRFSKPVHLVWVVLGALLGLLSGFFPAILVLGLFAGLFLLVFVLEYPILGLFMIVAGTPFLPTMAVAGLIILTYGAMIIKYWFGQKRKWVFSTLGLWILVYLAVSIIVAFTSYAPGSSVKIALLVATMTASYYLFYNLIDNRKQFDRILQLFLFCGLLVSLYGIYQKFFGNIDNTWIDQDMFSEIESRVYSTFANPNVLGEYLLLVIPLSIGYLFTRKNALSRLYYLGVTGATLLCMVFTYSRGCWVGLIIAAFVFILFYDKRLLWLGLLAAVVGFMVMPDSIVDRFLSIGNLTDTSTNYRVYIWLGTINLLKDFWLSGIGQGIDAYNLLYPAYSYNAISAPHAHNLYLVALTETGIVGLFLLAMVLVSFIRKSTQTIARAIDKRTKLIAIALLAGVIGFLVQGMFDYVWYNYRVVLIFWAVLAFAMTNRKLMLSEERGGQSHD